jgi:hypothetical protein
LAIGASRIERGAQLGDLRRQRVVEVAVAPVAEAVARHVDRRAKAAAVEQVGQGGALAGLEQSGGDGEAALVQLALKLGPVEGLDAVGQRWRGHGPTTPAGADL